MLEARDQLRKKIRASTESKVIINLHDWVKTATNNYIIQAIIGEEPDLKVTINRQVIKEDGTISFEPFSDNLSS